VYESDTQRGLLLLEDLGATLYLERLDAGDDPEPLYADALRMLAVIQVRGREACAQLAPYGRAELAREMALMPEWFLARHLSLTPSPDEAQLLGAAFEFLIQEALAQPVVFVHRDYHARNLMVVRERNPGIIDFQDALRGPVAYDLASLLKDCYIAWPRERVVHWVSGHRAQLRAQGGDGGASEAQFLRWFDLIGVQRHIKVLGIFCRLWYRDGKPGYLPDLPRTLDYVRDTCARYAELTALHSFLEQRVVEPLSRANAQVAADLARAADGHA
jgi:aminoglycoside/choline kinase family phosphotransferase